MVIVDTVSPISPQSVDTVSSISPQSVDTVSSIRHSLILNEDNS